MDGFVDLTKRKLKRAGIHSLYWNISLDDYAGDARVKKDLTKYISNIDKIIGSGFCLYIYGDPLSGKTWVSCLLQQEAMKRGITTLIYNEKDLIYSYTQENDWYFGSDSRVMSVGLLVLDDLGAMVEFNTKNDFVPFVVWSVVGERIKRKKAIICNSRFSIGDLVKQYEKYGVNANRIKETFENYFVPMKLAYQGTSGNPSEKIFQEYFRRDLGGKE